MRIMNIYIFVVFILCNSFCNVIYSQNPRFEIVVTEDGNDNLSVRDILQDQNGSIWFATFSGLYKFQGDQYILKHEFYNHKELNSKLTALAEDKNHNIWIGSSNGLAKYNPFTEDLNIYTSDTIPGAIGSSLIRSLEKDNKGRLWVGTQNEGLFLFKPDNGVFKKIQFDEFNIPTPRMVKTIFSDSNGKIWLGTLGDGLYCFSYSGDKVDSVINYSTDNFGNLSNNNVYGIFEDEHGTIAACTQNGLIIKRLGSETFEDISSKFLTAEYSTNYFRKIARANDGKLWILTYGGLIQADSFSDFETGNFVISKSKRYDPSSISHNQTMSILQDKSGIIWLGTESGLNKYSPYQNQFHTFSGEVMETLQELTATDYAPYKGGMLVLTLSDGILYNHNEKIEKFCDKLLITEELQDDKMLSLLVDSDNTIWIGTYKGCLLKIDKNCQSISIYRDLDENNSIYKLVEQDDQTILLGTYGQGLKYFDREKNTFAFDKRLDERVNINDLHIDKNQNLWVATQQGIFYRGYKSNILDHYLPENSADIHDGNIFYSIAESDADQIFVGGRYGLYVFNPEEKKFVIKEFNNISRVWITNMQFNSARELWLNLNFNQIARWDMHSDELQLFDVNNGVRHFKYNHRGFFIDKEDIIHVSGFNRLYHFNTLKPFVNNYSAPPILTNLVLNNRVVQVGKELNGQIVLTSNINYQDKLKLNHKNKDFKIFYTSASYINHRRNTYKYKLHGYNNDWIITSDKSVSFEDLKPGNYTFELHAANSEGYWSSIASKLEIAIMPSPFLTIWAILAYLMIATIVAYQFGKMIKSRILLRRELLIEKVKRLNEKKFHEERLRFYTNISHELRTPLTLITSPIKQIIANETNADPNKKLNRLILNNSQRLLLLVNRLLDFRKSLHNGLILKTSYCDAIEIVESIISSFNYMAQEKSISVKFNKEKNIIKGWFDREKLDIIVFNILSNSFKYSPNNGYITINLKTTADTTKPYYEGIELSVINSGQGIPKHLQEKVFERFYQVNNNSDSNNSGSGIGLALVKNMVELHHGKITLESEPGKSTCFSIFIPLEKDAYTENEIFDFSNDADLSSRELYHKFNLRDAKYKEKLYLKDVKKILIVEDNSELRNFIVELLSDEFLLLEANNGLEGLDLCEKEMPDLVISDVKMDGLNGWMLCKKLKSTSTTNHIPVILLTALSLQENKKTGYEVGADDFITKPFEPELLKIRVKNILKNRSYMNEGYPINISNLEKKSTISTAGNNFMKIAVSILEKNIDNPHFDINCFCNEMGTSSSKLYRKIKNSSGHSPVEFITDFRLRKAALLIRNSDLSISEIAYKVGFSDPRYFSRCFKKQFGIPPSEFRTAS